MIRFAQRVGEKDGRVAVVHAYVAMGFALQIARLYRSTDASAHPEVVSVFEEQHSILELPGRKGATRNGSRLTLAADVQRLVVDDVARTLNVLVGHDNAHGASADVSGVLATFGSLHLHPLRVSFLERSLH
jgi:hypothetical protein